MPVPERKAARKMELAADLPQSLRRHRSPVAPRQRTYIEVFAGCGGLSLGLHKSGWEGLFAVERDPMAFDTLRHNMLLPDAPYRAFARWPKWLPQQNMPIESLLDDPAKRKQLVALRGKVTLVAGGPPCQGFSVGGIRDGFDHRNQLVVRMMELVELVQPSIVLVENVEGMARPFVSKPGAASESVADAVVAHLQSLGYDATYLVVDASRFGVPQVRRRVLILGVAKSLSQDNWVADALPDCLESIRGEMLRDLGLSTTQPVTAGEAIRDLAGNKSVLCPDSPRFLSGTYQTGKALSAYAKLMRRGTPSSAIPNSHRFSKHGSRILALYQQAHDTQPKGRLSKSFLLSTGTKKDKKVLLDPDAPVSTITTHPDEFIHYLTPRNITVREMARLQSFPDDFSFHGRYTINGPRRRFDVARCSQVGNAVPPLLGQAVGLALQKLLTACEQSEATAPVRSEAMPSHRTIPILGDANRSCPSSI